jgi:hypothetical protein
MANQRLRHGGTITLDALSTAPACFFRRLTAVKSNTEIMCNKDT